MQKFNKNPPMFSSSSTIDSCLICLNTLSKSAIRGILHCGHSLFCVQCILGWAEITNKCPVCQTRFLFIDSGKPKKSTWTILNRIEVEERDQGEFILPNLNIPCKNCGSESEQDRLLLCDKCGAGVHIGCLGMDEYPQLEEWYCDTCLEDEPRHKQVKQWKDMKAAGRVVVRRSLRLKRRAN